MNGQSLSFDDLQERLLELGSSAKKKSGNVVTKGYAGAANKAFEFVTGTVSSGNRSEQSSQTNHTPLPDHLIDAARNHKDQQDLSAVRSQLANFQNGDSTKKDERVEFQNFFRKYKQEEETYQQRKKREEEEKEQMEEYQELEKKKKEEEEKEQQTAAAAPQGKIRKNIFAKVKKRSSMIETKASSGKQ